MTALPVGLALSPTGLVSGIPTKLEVDFYEIRVVDSRGLSSTSVIALGTTRGNLTFDNIILPPARLDQFYSQQIRVSGGTPPYRFVFETFGLGNGLSMSTTGLVSGIPSIRTGYTFATIRVDDNVGNASIASVAFVITQNAPTLFPSTMPQGIVGTPYLQPVPLQSMGTNVRVFPARGPSLPPGMSIQDNRFLAGKPLQAGTFRFNLLARNQDFSDPVLAEITFIVIPPFTLTSQTSFEAPLLTPFSSSITPIGGLPPYRFEIVSRQFPPGLILSSNGTISGSPTQAGTFNPVIRASDSQNRTSDFSFTFRVSDNRLQLSLANPIPPATLYLPFNIQPITIGGRPPYSYSLSGNPLPSGLSLNPDTGVISGIPIFRGLTSTTLRVLDSAGNSQDLPLQISSTPPLRLAAGTVLTPYSLNISTLSIFQGSTNFALEQSVIPGLTLRPDGLLSGAPQSQGEFPVVISSTNSFGTRTNWAFNLWVSPASRSIEQASLPGAVVGSSYSQTLTASGFTPPLNWSVSQGSLPAGLTLNPATGLISGTPFTPSTAPFAVRVADATNSTTATFYFTVSPAGTPQLNFIGSAANYDPSGIAAGELLTAFGNNLGPAVLTSFRPENNRIPTTLANTRVWFDSLAAPLLYTQNGQLSFISPFGIPAFDPVRVVVERAGIQSAPFIFLPRLSKPALFTVDGTGSGPAALLNENTSINSESNPAEPASIIVLYLTGNGPMLPPGSDGVLATAGSNSILRPTIRINGQPSEVLYLGNAPGLVQGVAQANIRLPANTISGKNGIEISLGGSASTTTTTVWVR